MAWVQVSLRAGARRPGCGLSPGAPALRARRLGRGGVAAVARAVAGLRGSSKLPRYSPGPEVTSERL